MKRLFLILTLAWVLPSHATVLIDHGQPLTGSPAPNDDGIRSDLQTSANGHEAGSVVTLSSAITLQSVQWWGFYIDDSSQIADQFKFRIYSVTGAGPGTTPLYDYSLTSATRALFTSANGPFGGGMYQYGSAVPATTLTPGNYLIVIANNTDAYTNTSWYWANSTTTNSTSWQRNLPPASDTTWTSLSNIPAFNVSGTSAVPEPSVTAFGAMAGLCWLPRRWRRAHPRKKQRAC